MTRTLLPVALLLASLAFAADKPAGKPSDKPRPGVMVMYFEVSSADPELQLLSKGMAQLLITDLIANSAIKVAEREKLEAVMAELKLQHGGAVDPATAQKLGKMIGAKYIVGGSITQVPGGKVVFAARVVKADENVALTANLKSIGKPDDVLEAQEKLVAGISDTIAKAESTEPPPTPPKKASKLKLETAVKYAKALDAKDKKDNKTAKQLLEEVKKDQPDFVLASLDLDRLMQ